VTTFTYSLILFGIHCAPFKRFLALLPDIALEFLAAFSGVWTEKSLGFGIHICRASTRAGGTVNTINC